MRFLKRFEGFKVNNIEHQDIVDAIQNGGRIYAGSIKEFPQADEEEPLIPVSIDNDGLITVLYDNSEYEVCLHNVTKIDN
jgi:hypothetical protein